MQIAKLTLAVLVILILVLSIGLGIALSYYYSLRSTLTTASSRVTITSNQTVVSPEMSTVTNMATFTYSQITTAYSNFTRTTLVNFTNASTALIVVAVTTLPKTPFNYTDYLAAGTSFGGCYEFSPPSAVPCFTNDIEGAEVFNCLSAAATLSGCTTQIYSPPNYGDGVTTSGFSITVWYPYVNASQDEPSWANCKYGVAGNTAPPYGFCITISPTAFLLTIAGGPPT